MAAVNSAVVSCGPRDRATGGGVVMTYHLRGEERAHGAASCNVSPSQVWGRRNSRPTVGAAHCGRLPFPGSSRWSQASEEFHVRGSQQLVARGPGPDEEQMHIPAGSDQS